MKLNLFCFIICLQFSYSQISKKIDSNYLDEERIITISLPSNYHQDMNKRFSVLYVLDGEYVFNYAAGITEFLANGFGHLPKMIVVGIPNTDRGRDLYVNFKNDGNYLKFVDFLEKEVMTLIQSKYRTNGFDILYGWSSGSGISMYILATNSKLFDGHIQSGTGIGGRGEEFFKSNIPKMEYENTYLYASTETPGFRAAGLDRYATTIKVIRPKGLNYKFEKLDKASHVDVLSLGLEKGLKYIFNDFYIPESEIEKGYDSILAYFDKIQDNYSVKLDIPEGAIVETVSILQGMKKNDDILKLLEYGVKLHPNSIELYGIYGEIQGYLKKHKEEAECYKKALENSHLDEINKRRFEVLYHKALKKLK